MTGDGSDAVSAIGKFLEDARAGIAGGTDEGDGHVDFLGGWWVSITAAMGIKVPFALLVSF